MEICPQSSKIACTHKLSNMQKYVSNLVRLPIHINRQIWKYLPNLVRLHTHINCQIWKYVPNPLSLPTHINCQIRKYAPYLRRSLHVNMAKFGNSFFFFFLQKHLFDVEQYKFALKRCNETCVHTWLEYSIRRIVKTAGFKVQISLQIHST